MDQAKVVVLTIDYHHFVVPVEVAVAFLAHAEEVKQDFKAETGYHYYRVDERATEIVVKQLHGEILPPEKGGE